MLVHGQAGAAELLVASLAAARAAGSDVLARDLRAVADAAAAPGRQLCSLAVDAARGEVLAAVACGDLRRASQLAVLVPGAGTGPTDLPRMCADADGIVELAEAMAARTCDESGTAVVVWLGYRPPQVAHAWLDRERSVASARVAEAAGAGLAGFCASLPKLPLTVVGHSYGSVVAGQAAAAVAKAGGRLCDRLVAAGSPGLGFASLAALGVRGPQVFVLEAAGDAVAGLGWFGADPDRLAGVRRLSTRKGPGTSAARGHCHYLQAGTTAAWNIAAVCGGRLADAVAEDGRSLYARMLSPVKDVALGWAARRYHQRDGRRGR